ncbi:16S rRNA (guanine(527)-N(7))-methyltransferase RsmG [Methylovirgula sp. 4M-Z18]|uniref:16S rRNA (guanine(527)-N(7))-methyltransferase RsmG n=1 Tax=Methylovirgula sp. 4M-Z18 TaxID=2293567 RepID=UPI000E2F0E4B|nr:16S rRNA (guanine(527)-N(7))-methyltransferase RsmG [Methylovirgula sp. 4M-Z18]RFB78038.1 16S rRNA (guanine(527)-N(7))-methyltransferase RsmG [Methylovirgula sp. 4M-Z18]
MSKQTNTLNDYQTALSLMDVSRETLERLQIYADLLIKWQKTINLVSPATLPHLWVRHIADSAQVLDCAPEARVWVDIGSGGGFPGLVTAMRLADRPDAKVHLVESDQRKCAFLREVSRATGAPAEVHVGRIETILPGLNIEVNAVSARALAPLAQLVDYTKNLLEKGAIGVFLKGQDVDKELTSIVKYSNLNYQLKLSKTHQDARIVIVKLRDAST